MDATTAWIVLSLGWLAPILHVAVSRKSGPLLPPEGSRCPFGPRMGWLVVVVLTGIVGWFLYLHARYRRAAVSGGPRHGRSGRG